MATLKNTTVNDTGNLTVASGTTAQRPASPALGMLRYNTTLGVLEQYTDIGWQGIEAAPVLTSVSGLINSNTDTTITVNGSNFKTGSIVSIEGNAVTGSRSLTTTFVSSSQLTATTNATAVNYTGGNTFDVKVTNPSGLSALLTPAGTVDRDPVWSTSAGNLGTIFDSARSGRTFTVSASDPDGQTITYSVASGSLPTGMSLNSSTGVISGTPNAVGSDTTSTFTLRASSTSGSLTSTADREFNIIVKAPVVTSFTSTGSQTFSVPSGISAVEVLIVAGGGGGGGATGFEVGGGGGAGGLIYSSSTPVTPGGSVSVTVGSGGTGAPNQSTQPPNSSGDIAPGKGGNSSFGPLTAIGGGIGGGQYWDGQPGGSGGGDAGNIGDSTGGSGTPGQGNAGGGSFNNAGASTGGGGGGAGAVGETAPSGRGGNGGNGLSYSTSGSSVTYAGGGGGGGAHDGSKPGGAGGSGGGGPGSTLNATATNGTTNRGGGGGGSGSSPGGKTSGNGGPGIVVVRY
jgi:hypothetical protein